MDFSSMHLRPLPRQAKGACNYLSPLGLLSLTSIIRSFAGTLAAGGDLHLMPYGRIASRGGEAQRAASSRRARLFNVAGKPLGSGSSVLPACTWLWRCSSCCCMWRSTDDEQPAAAAVAARRSDDVVAGFPSCCVSGPVWRRRQADYLLIILRGRDIIVVEKNNTSMVVIR